jgi:hypothetical protein
MDVNTSIIFGISAAIVNTIAFIPYILSIYKGKTKPERSSWWIWTVLMTVALFAQIAAGATWSVLLTVVFVVGNLLVALLSIKYGYGKFTRKNTVSLLITVLALALWYITEDPLIALLITIAVDFLAYWLTIMKSWKAPYSENILAWILMTIAAVLSILSVGEFKLVLLVFPIYVASVSIIGVAVLIKRRKWRSNRIKDGLKKQKAQA